MVCDAWCSIWRIGALSQLRDACGGAPNGHPRSRGGSAVRCGEMRCGSAAVTVQLMQCSKLGDTHTDILTAAVGC